MRPAELFSIVIVGNMNPRIHHPAWYLAAKVLSVEEARAANQSPVICTPEVATFAATGFGVLCSLERWEIQTQDVATLARLVAIAGTTFDVLKHTPVTAFGFNYHFVRETRHADIGKRLAEMVNRLPLGRTSSDRDSATIATMTPLDEGGHVQEVIAAIPENPSIVRVAYNVHHPIALKATKPEDMIFDLTPMLEAAFQKDYDSCLRRADLIGKALSSD